MIDLAGRVALVTGGSRGIGRACALRLAEAGADVVVNFVSSQQAAMEVAEQINGLGRQAFVVKADVSEQDDVESLMDFITEQAGQLDILVSNAATGGFRPLLNSTERNFRAAFGTNVLALLYLVGVISLVTVGYLSAPSLILAGQSVLSSVFFGRRVTLVTLAVNLVTILAVGALLSMGVATVDTRFYEPTVFLNWLRVAAIFAVFAGIAVIGVDVITTHLNKSLRDQAELIEHLKGAMQLHEEAEQKRRAAESRLRDSGQHDLRGPTS